MRELKLKGIYFSVLRQLVPGWSAVGAAGRQKRAHRVVHRFGVNHNVTTGRAHFLLLLAFLIDGSSLIAMPEERPRY